jgi:DNA-binding response OmpR family regulator
VPVLIVEDDPDTRETLETLLQMHGVAARAVENGQQAWDLLRSAEPAPCLILLDLMMPVLSGWQLRERMIADEKLRRIPVIVMSATADSSTTLEAAAVMRKPIDFESLVRRVREYCECTTAGAPGTPGAEERKAASR